METYREEMGVTDDEGIVVVARDGAAGEIGLYRWRGDKLSSSLFLCDRDAETLIELLTEALESKS